MAEAVIMPRQGQSVETCIFTEWFKNKGERIKKGDLLFAYETDKAEFEQEALVDGVLLETFAEAGDEIPVLQIVGVIGEPGENINQFIPANAPDTASVPEKAKSETPSNQRKSQEKNDQSGDNIPDEESGISPRAKKLAESRKIPLTGIHGSGPYGRIIEADIKKAMEQKPKITPLALSIAEHEQVQIPSKGSGYGGRILAADVKIAKSVALADDYEDIKLSNIRKIIAQNMYESLANSAQLTLHSSADARKLLEYRKLIKDKIDKEGYSYNITINDMVSYAAIKALLKHRAMNAHFQGDSIRYFSNVHLGFAVDTPRGLMVPTIRNANHLSPVGLSAKIKELASACQAGNINPEMLQGATFTLTNLGSYGIEMFTPVLNPPQVGILGINAIVYRPAEIGGGALGFIPRIGLSLTFDHRAIDGAPAAAFLKEVATEIENLAIDIS